MDAELVENADRVIGELLTLIVGEVDVDSVAEIVEIAELLGGIVCETVCETDEDVDTVAIGVRVFMVEEVSVGVTVEVTLLENKAEKLNVAEFV